MLDKVQSGLGNVYHSAKTELGHCRGLKNKVHDAGASAHCAGCDTPRAVKGGECLASPCHQSAGLCAFQRLHYVCFDSPPIRGQEDYTG